MALIKGERMRYATTKDTNKALPREELYSRTRVFDHPFFQAKVVINCRRLLKTGSDAM